MNPYASFLGARDALEVISSTSDQLKSMIASLGAAGAERPRAPGKWCAREIICHLADCETVFAFRLRQTLAEDHHVIQPFDQDQWGKRYDTCDLEAALEVFGALRKWNLALIRSVTAADLKKPVLHPERGEMTFQVVVETMAGHDLNHLGQIESIVGRAAQA